MKFAEANIALRKYPHYDRSEAERVLFTNIVDSLVREPARPDPPRPGPADRDAFQTLISQELLELNETKFNHI